MHFFDRIFCNAASFEQFEALDGAQVRLHNCSFFEDGKMALKVLAFILSLHFKAFPLVTLAGKNAINSFNVFRLVYKV